MHKKTSLILIFLAGALLIIAGCTQPAQPANQVNLSQASTGTDTSSLLPLAMTASDFPPSYMIIENRTKTRDELSPLALDLGWQNGYIVRSWDAGTHDSAATEITQIIALYSNDNVQKIISLAETQDRSDQDMIFYDLPLPATGKYTRAFHGSVNVTSNNQQTGFLHTSITEKNSDSTISKQNFSEVLFIKGNVFEVIRISGPHVDDGLLQNLSIVAYQRIS